MPAPESTPSDLRPRRERRARSRRTTVVVIGAASVLAVAAVVGTVVVDGSGSDAPAAAADTKDWSEVAPTAGATEAPAPLPDGDTRALGQEVATTVGLDETATFPGSIQARIASVTPTSTDGGRVGELSGDAVDVRLELVNVTDAAVAVDSVAVNVYYGADRTPATPADSDTVIRGSLAPGASATGDYVFSVPAASADAISVVVARDAGSPVVVFQ
ncbi:hypothetical protein [Clavibacter michiganensis]|uniref:hypothetical protein n=1 Tax=Clavibacter michiganensis TaxID=28447 RepID=UPI001D0B83C8|nr:hypothetical protein [Clavibacter michiganensis]MDO4029610.1 hypothetical protein [Clavibacter michiganensis]MDO4044411.1 hypothetical protein [Clavibacter michiganensis]MDO4054529.1 hypothetical protein [Clavibacter michiganensis]MDO4057210.1 hypothetical protein [Clavibacter michiganensis]MDO4069796.1 hypothetical protein [Clavibacter michiganensis]